MRAAPKAASCSSSAASWCVAIPKRSSSPCAPAAPMPKAVPQFTADDKDVAKILFHHHLAPDIRLVGFKLRPSQIRTEPWWFLITENPSGPRFGLDLRERQRGGQRSRRAKRARLERSRPAALRAVSLRARVRTLIVEDTDSDPRKRPGRATRRSSRARCCRIRCAPPSTRTSSSRPRCHRPDLCRKSISPNCAEWRRDVLGAVRPTRYTRPRDRRPDRGDRGARCGDRAPDIDGRRRAARQSWRTERERLVTSPRARLARPQAL